MHGGQWDMLQHGFFERRCRATVQLRHRGEQSGAYEGEGDGWLESRQRDTASSEHTRNVLTFLEKAFL